MSMYSNTGEERSGGAEVPDKKYEVMNENSFSTSGDGEVETPVFVCENPNFTMNEDDGDGFPDQVTIRTVNNDGKFSSHRLSKLSIHTNNDEFVYVGGHPPVDGRISVQSGRSYGSRQSMLQSTDFLITSDMQTDWSGVQSEKSVKGQVSVHTDSLDCESVGDEDLFEDATQGLVRRGALSPDYITAPNCLGSTTSLSENNIVEQDSSNLNKNANAGVEFGGQSISASQKSINSYGNGGFEEGGPFGSRSRSVSRQSVNSNAGVEFGGQSRSVSRQSVNSNAGVEYGGVNCIPTRDDNVIGFETHKGLWFHFPQERLVVGEEARGGDFSVVDENGNFSLVDEKKSHAPSKSFDVRRQDGVHFSNMPELYSHPDDQFGVNESIGEPFRPTNEHQSTPQAVKASSINESYFVNLDPCSATCRPCFSSLDNDSVPPALIVTSAMTPHATRGSVIRDEVSPGLNKTQVRRMDYESKDKFIDRVEIAVQTGDTIRKRQVPESLMVAMNRNGEYCQQYTSKDEMANISRPISDKSFERKGHPAAMVLTNMLQQRHRHTNVSQSTTTPVSSPQMTVIHYESHLTDENSNNLVQPLKMSYGNDDHIISKEAADDLRRKVIADSRPPSTPKSTRAFNGRNFANRKKNQNEVDLTVSAISRISMKDTAAENINELMSSTCTPSERTSFSSPYKWQVREYRYTTQIKRPDARWEDKKHKKIGSTVRRHIPRGHIRDLAAAFDQMTITATKEADVLVHKTKARVRRQSEPSQNDSLIMKTEELVISKDDSIIDHHQAYGGYNEHKFITDQRQYDNPLQSKIHFIKHNGLDEALLDIGDEYDLDSADSHLDNRRTSTPLDIVTDQNDHLGNAFGRVSSIHFPVVQAAVVHQDGNRSPSEGNCVKAIAANFEYNISAERASIGQCYSSMKSIDKNRAYERNTHTRVAMGSKHTSSTGHITNMDMQAPRKRRIEYNVEDDQTYAQVYRTDSRPSRSHTSQTNDYVTLQRDGYIDEENLNGQIDRMFEFVDEHDGLSTVDRERCSNDDITSRLGTIHQEHRSLNPDQIYRKGNLKYSVSGYRNLQRESRNGMTLPSSDSTIRFSPITAPPAGHSVSAYRSREGTIGQKIDATSYASRSCISGRPSALATSTPMDSPIGTVHAAVRMEDSFVSSITTASQDPTIEYKRQINKLNHQLRTQEEQIEMTLKVLVLARKKQKSMQELSAQRTLLVARERVEMLKREVKRISALSAVRHPPPPVNRDLKGSMFISNITVHLNRNFCQRQPDINASYAFVVLLKCGAEVEATGPVSLLAHHQMRLRQLHFAENVRFSNLPVDFSVILEVYAMKLSKVKPEELSCASTIANKCRNLLTPVARKANRSGLEQPFGDFVRCGYIVLNRDTVGTNKFYLDDAEYPLEGTIEVFSRCTTLPPAIEVDNRGFLTMYQTISGMASWERYWAVLRRGMVFFWKYPDDERINKNPVAHMDLTKCTNEELVPCSAEQCPRPFAFSIDILVSTTPSIMEKKRVLLSADSRELLLAWLQAFNETLLVLRG